jgi:Fic family protein
MEIKESPSGKIIKIQSGYEAFMPYPLPPQFTWDTRLASTLSRADHLLGMLSREGSKLPNPHLLMRPFIAREAVLSSMIEGTQATLGEVLANEMGALVHREQADLQEVQNYIIALDYGVRRLHDLPLSLRLIKEIHQKLMQGVRGAHATPGEFRRTQNWIGPSGCTLNTAKYVPPPVEVLMDCLGNLERFLHDKEFPPLIQIALCHYQFEAIHPFLDGNGRVGRLLITLLLIERKMLPAPFLYLSAFFEATRDEYYKHLYNVSSKGAWYEWLTYFLNGVAVQSSDVLSRTERINALLNDWLTLSRKSEVMQNTVQCFAVNPYFTINKIAENSKVAFTTAQRAIETLEDLGIVSKVSEAKRGRIYCATKILDILEEPTKITQNF